MSKGMGKVQIEVLKAFSEGRDLKPKSNSERASVSRAKMSLVKRGFLVAYTPEICRQGDGYIFKITTAGMAEAIKC
jgi:hypothetical protein